MAFSFQTVLFGSSLIDVNPGLTFWTLITFIVVAVIMRKFAWGPILGFIHDREKAIEDSIEAAKNEREEAARLVAEQKSEVSRIKAEMAEQANRSSIEMDRMRDEMMKRSRQESEEMLAAARRTIASEREIAKADIRREAVELALAAAEHLMKSNTSREEQERLTSDFIQTLDDENLFRN